MEASTYFETIRNHIANDDLQAALKQLRILLENSPKLDEVILQSGRFNDIKRQIRLGAVSHAESNLTQNQIRAGLLDLLREIAAQSEQQPVLQQEIRHAISIQNGKNILIGSNISAGGNVVIGDTTMLTESKTRRHLSIFLYLFVPFLAITGAYWWFRYQEMQRPLGLKLRLENRTPNPELPEPEGQLTLTYGSKTEIKPVVAAEALFDGIPANFKNEHVQLHWEAKGFVDIDTTFLLKNEAMVLPVFRNKDLALISGFILDAAGNPIEGVKVSTSCCFAHTLASGEFTLSIPFNHQKIEQRLDVYKLGYKQKSITTPVIPGETVRLILNTP